MKALPQNTNRRLQEIKETIDVWQRAPSLAWAAKKLRVSPHVLTSRVTRYRLCGVPMKRFQHSTRQKEIDWAYWARYALEHHPA